MPTVVHEFDWPDRVVIGTVGMPGERTFYLQAREGARVVSIALEKAQSAELGRDIDQVLNGLMAASDNRYSVPAQAPPELVDDDPLDQPVLEQFRAGLLQLGWDPTTAQIVVEAYPLVDEPEAAEDDEREPEEIFVLRMPVGTARAFAQRTLAVVAAGRPRCPRCGGPIDPDGHACPADGL